MESGQATSGNAEERTPKEYTSIKGFGLKADRNPRHRRTMEVNSVFSCILSVIKIMRLLLQKTKDTHTHVDGFAGNPKFGYFGVYDGHGGKQAADYIKENLHLVCTTNKEICQ